MNKILILFLSASCTILAQPQFLTRDNFEVKNETSSYISCMLSKEEETKIDVVGPRSSANKRIINSLYVTLLKPVPVVVEYQFAPAENNFFSVVEEKNSWKLVPQKISNNVKYISNPLEVPYKSVVSLMKKIQPRFPDWPFYILQLPKDNLGKININFTKLKNASKNLGSDFEKIIVDAYFEILLNIKNLFPASWMYKLLNIPGDYIPSEDKEGNPIDTTQFITYARAYAVNNLPKDLKDFRMKKVEELINEAYLKLIESSSRSLSSRSIKS